MPNGACRLCMVEIEGERRSVASCCYSVYDGMKVNTITEKIVNYRKLTLQFIISDYPLDCMYVKKVGNAYLKNMRMNMALNKLNIMEKEPKGETEMDLLL